MGRPSASERGNPASSSAGTPALRKYFWARTSVATWDHAAGTSTFSRRKTTEPSGFRISETRRSNASPAYGLRPSWVNRRRIFTRTSLTKAGSSIAPKPDSAREGRVRTVVPKQQSGDDAAAAAAAGREATMGPDRAPVRARLRRAEAELSLDRESRRRGGPEGFADHLRTARGHPSSPVPCSVARGPVAI